MPRKAKARVRARPQRRARPSHPPLDPSELSPEERRELVRRFLADPEAQERAAQRYADGLTEDARAKA